MKQNRFSTRLLLCLTALILLLGFFTGLLRAEPPAGLPPSYAARAETDKTGFKTLKVGMGGASVRQMQSVLYDMGYYSGAVDGNFSRVFEAAVKTFQKDFGLAETGTVDASLYSLLMEEYSGLLQQPVASGKRPSAVPGAPPDFVEEDGCYSDKDHVSAYLRKFGKLPANYITKQEAQRLGWVAADGNMWEIAPGKSIGGDRFGNYEGVLPVKTGRKYFECDIDFDGGYRNAKRIIFSNDGLIFYTEDHYQTFEELKE